MAAIYPLAAAASRPERFACIVVRPWGYPRRVSYFRQTSIREDPDGLLKPENQVSTPWGGPDHGRCDKCGGSGEVRHRCLSCLESDEPDAECEACAGRAEWDDICPTCEGDGEITRTRRRGVSVLPTIAGLRRYLADRDVDPEGCAIVELDGPLSDDRDLDADSGALLIFPREVVAVHPLELPDPR